MKRSNHKKRSRKSKLFTKNACENFHKLSVYARRTALPNFLSWRISFHAGPTCCLSKLRFALVLWAPEWFLPSIITRRRRHRWLVTSRPSQFLFPIRSRRSARPRLPLLPLFCRCLRPLERAHRKHMLELPPARTEGQPEARAAARFHGSGLSGI